MHAGVAAGPVAFSITHVLRPLDMRARSVCAGQKSSCRPAAVVAGSFEAVPPGWSRPGDVALRWGGVKRRRGPR